MILVNLMMKTNSKLINILAVLLIIGLLIPGISFAKGIKDWFNIRQRNTDRDQEQEKNASSSYNQIRNKQSQFCNLIGKWTDKVDQNITQRQTKIYDKQIERLQKLDQRRENRDTKLEQFRQEWETMWEKHFLKLDEKASTSAEKQALVEFKETVKEAIASRQAAVDAAISKYRADLDKMVADRKTAAENARITYLTAYQAAIDKAKADCAQAGADPAKIRQELQTALKAAKDKYQSDVKTIEKTEVKPLVEARQQAFKEALDYFKKAMEAARVKLRAAFNL